MSRYQRELRTTITNGHGSQMVISHYVLPFSDLFPVILSLFNAL